MTTEFWEDWQLEILDNYILGYEVFENQEELAEAIGKSINAVKIKLSRTRKEIEEEGKRELTIEEYKIFLSNRFDKSSKEIAELIGASEIFLLQELDEIDCLECKQYLTDGFEDRIMTLDEIKLILSLYKEGKNFFQLAHIFNRPISKIKEMIESYGI